MMLLDNNLTHPLRQNTNPHLKVIGRRWDSEPRRASSASSCPPLPLVAGEAVGWVFLQLERGSCPSASQNTNPHLKVIGRRWDSEPCRASSVSSCPPLPLVAGEAVGWVFLQLERGSCPSASQNTNPHLKVGICVLAEAVGFEPTGDFTRHSISSRDRYDHFDTPPYRKSLNVKRNIQTNGIIP